MNHSKLTSFIFSGVLATCLILTGCQSSSYENVQLNSKIDSVSYSFGYNIGKNMANNGMGTIKLEVLMTGMHQAMAEDTSLINQRKMMALLRNYQMEARARMIKQRMEKAEKNKKKAQEFLAKNKKKDSVKVTKSGLQYKVLKEGNRTTPTAEDTVKVHYKGTLLSGEVFNSSYKRGQPATFPVKGVIEGWTEGLQLMKEGAVYKFWIPPTLGYGTNTRPGSPIGPNALLIFKVELLEVK